MMSHAAAAEHDVSSAFITTNQMIAQAFASALAGMIANLAGFADAALGPIGGVSAIAWLFLWFALMAAAALPASAIAVRLSEAERARGRFVNEAIDLPPRRRPFCLPGEGGVHLAYQAPDAGKLLGKDPSFCLQAATASSRTMAAHFSPIMIEGALVLPPGTCGMIDASATRNSRPRRRATADRRLRRPRAPCDTCRPGGGWRRRERGSPRSSPLHFRPEGPGNTSSATNGFSAACVAILRLNRMP